MLKVGITGGIGSGKSTVSRVFETWGIPVYYADQAALRLVETDDALKANIIDLFGEGAYKDGIYQRQYIASIIFNSPEKRNQLNALIHPATIRDAERWMIQQSTPYAIKEAALIFESGSERQLDFIIGVTAPLETRVNRVMLRDGASRDAVLARIHAQMDEDEKMSKCDAVLLNEGNALLLPQIENLHQAFLQKAPKR
jgi:dephospho-CoA kinase